MGQNCLNDRCVGLNYARLRAASNPQHRTLGLELSLNSHQPCFNNVQWRGFSSARSVIILSIVSGTHPHINVSHRVTTSSYSDPICHLALSDLVSTVTTLIACDDELILGDLATRLDAWPVSDPFVIGHALRA
eukprot:5382094-Amphidinium_carterae.1